MSDTSDAEVLGNIYFFFHAEVGIRDRTVAGVQTCALPISRQVMGTFEGELEFDSYRDEYQVGLREIIDAKIEGREILTQEVEAPPKVVNLMEALRKSLDTISANKKKAVPVERMAAPKKRAGARG